MGIARKTTRFKKRIYLFYLFVVAISPFLVSSIFHMVALYLSGDLAWHFVNEQDLGKDVTAQIVLDGQKDDQLRFQGTDPLDSFETEDRMVYPLQEVEYRPVTPDVALYPEPKVNETLDIISVEAAAIGTEWVNPSTGRQPLYTGPEMLVGSFSMHIQQLREHGLDVVFVFDSTASMDEYLIEVKFKIESLAIALKKLVPTCRIGLVTYRDVMEDFTTKIQPLTYAISPLQDFLSGIDAYGGVDLEEAVEQGLMDAVEKMKWHRKSRKFILLIGDAPPHAKDLPLGVEAVKKFRGEMGGVLSVIDVRAPKYPADSESFVSPSQAHQSPESLINKENAFSVMEAFQIFAEAGGGESARLIDEEKVVKNMLLLIFGSRWEMYLDEFMKNL